MIVFDIETGPLPLAELRASLPPFDEEEVKVGNLKDPDKIKAKIEEARVAHEEQFIARAALSPLTGRIICIGYLSTDKGATVIDAGEKDGGGEGEILMNFWRRYGLCRRDKRLLVGHNLVGFDIPFIVRRSWLLGVDVAATVFERGRYLDSLTFADTMQLWSCGTRDPWIKLETLSKAFGGGGKPIGEDGEKVDGAMFADLWRLDRAKAEAYLRNDLEMTARVAQRMGLI